MGHDTAHHSGQDFETHSPDAFRLVADVVVHCDQWHDVADLEDTIRAAATATAAQRQMRSETVCSFENGHVTVVLADDARVQDLNCEFRGKNKPTNVLSFPAPADPGLSEPGSDARYFGDIVLAYETIRQEAEAAEKPISAHLTHLVVHGILHLFGYDHATDVDAEQMEALEVKVLAKLNIENPYSGENHLSHDA